VTGKREKIMSVQINIPQFLHHLSGGVSVVNVEGKTVGECLDHLIEEFPQLRESLFGEEGKLLNLLNVYVNGESSYPEELARPVKDGDRLDIMYTLVGG
jgi:molybdopterin synthase sulfur carrier subunit